MVMMMRRSGKRVPELQHPSLSATSKSRSGKEEKMSYSKSLMPAPTLRSYTEEATGKIANVCGGGCSPCVAHDNEKLEIFSMPQNTGMAKGMRVQFPDGESIQCF